MNPYLFTITFLLMMSFLTSSEVMRFAQQSLENTCYFNSCSILEAAEESREYSHLEELRGEENKEPIKRERKNKKPKKEVKRIPRLNISTARPPNSARINLYSLLHKEPHVQLPDEFVLYEVLARLMRSLYKEAAFFIQSPGSEYALLDKLIEKKEITASFTTVDEFCSLDLEDPQLQGVFFHMLKGTKNAPSLLNYITFDKIDSPQKQARKINLLFADVKILRAMFPDASLADQLIAKRELIWQEILDQEKKYTQKTLTEGKNRTEFGQDLEAALKEVLLSAGLDFEKYKKHVFDCTLSEPGDVIFVEDPLTQEIRREKYIPHVKTRKLAKASA